MPGKTIIALFAIAAAILVATPTESSARGYGRYYYGYPYGYGGDYRNSYGFSSFYGSFYNYSGCYLARQRVRTPHGWRWRRYEVCD